MISAARAASVAIAIAAALAGGGSAGAVVMLEGAGPAVPFAHVPGAGIPRNRGAAGRAAAPATDHGSVPEIAEWGLLFAGLGLTGAIARRRSSVAPQCA